jgi:hypothetical protein
MGDAATAEIQPSTGPAISALKMIGTIRKVDPFPMRVVFLSRELVRAEAPFVWLGRGTKFGIKFYGEHLIFGISAHPPALEHVHELVTSQGLVPVGRSPTPLSGLPRQRGHTGAVMIRVRWFAQATQFPGGSHGTRE